MRKKEEEVMHEEISERVEEFIVMLLDVVKSNEKDNIVDRLKGQERGSSKGFTGLPRKGSS